MYCCILKLWVMDNHLHLKTYFVLQLCNCTSKVCHVKDNKQKTKINLLKRQETNNLNLCLLKLYKCVNLCECTGSIVILVVQLWLVTAKIWLDLSKLAIFLHAQSGQWMLYHSSHVGPRYEFHCWVEVCLFIFKLFLVNHIQSVVASQLSLIRCWIFTLFHADS